MRKQMLLIVDCKIFWCEKESETMFFLSRTYIQTVQHCSIKSARIPLLLNRCRLRKKESAGPRRPESMPRSQISKVSYMGSPLAHLVITSCAGTCGISDPLSNLAGTIEQRQVFQVRVKINDPVSINYVVTSMGRKLVGCSEIIERVGSG